MRILITGAAGHFPSKLIPHLEALGHELNLFDVALLNFPRHRVFQADIRDAGAVDHAVSGCDLVVHALALHGNMLGLRSDQDFHSVNGDGTMNVLQSMRRHGVKQLVFSSSEVVYGHSFETHRTVDENTPCSPSHVYGLTKVLNEEAIRFYARHEGLQAIVLRYGCFVPSDPLTAGIGRLNNWLDVEDVVHANLAAISKLAHGRIAHEVFLIQSAKPFKPSDWPGLSTDPDGIVERYFPKSLALLEQHKLSIPRIAHEYDIRKAQMHLGYSPIHSFGSFLSWLSKKDTAV